MAEKHTQQTQGTHARAAGEQQPQASTGGQRQRAIAQRDPGGGLGRRGSIAPYAVSPFSMMRRMMEDMDRLFEDFGFGSFGGGSQALTPGRIGGEMFTPAVEVMERDGKLIVRADLPGMKQEDVRVHLEEGSLVLEGERRSEHEESREGYFHTERSYGSFQRQIPLPRGVDPQSCEASFDHGVLEVRLDLPKETRRRIEVRTGSQGATSDPGMAKGVPIGGANGPTAEGRDAPRNGSRAAPESRH